MRRDERATNRYKLVSLEPFDDVELLLRCATPNCPHRSTRSSLTYGPMSDQQCSYPSTHSAADCRPAAAARTTPPPGALNSIELFGM